ncbi:WzyE family oligosaccharide polymerase, partial [Escherichia coli]
IIIPRFLWEDKPINVLNNGYFYTTEVLSLDTNLTMSPTFLGTSLIMFGSWFYWVGGFISGVILFVFDRSFSHSSNLYWKIILLSSVGYLFFWVRDGFEVFCYILIKFFIVMFIYKNLTIIYKSLARKNEF